MYIMTNSVKGKSGKSYEVFCARDTKTFNGLFSIIVRDEKGTVIETESFRDIKIRTGTRNGWQKAKDWQRGVGGIPEGAYFIWVNPKFIQQKGQFNPKGREIGQAYHVSSNKRDNLTITEDGGTTRIAIMIHPDNDVEGSGGVAGSIGCIVTPANKQGRIDFKKIADKLQAIFNDGVEHLPLTVFRKDI
jgi:hypothetical protein